MFIENGVNYLRTKPVRKAASFDFAFLIAKTNIDLSVSVNMSASGSWFDTAKTILGHSKEAMFKSCLRISILTSK